MLSLDAGYSRIDPKGATAPHDGLMLRLVVARQVTSRSTIEIVGGRIFTDSGNLLRLTEQRNGSGSDARLTPSGATTFDSSYGSLIWSTTLNRTAIQLSGEYHKERHADSAFQFDRSRIVTNAQLSRTLTERLTFGIGAHYIYENYDSQDYRGDWIRGVLMLDSRLARTIIARLEYLHDIRHSSIPEFRYTNKQVWLRLNYNPKARR